MNTTVQNKIDNNDDDASPRLILSRMAREIILALSFVVVGIAAWMASYYLLGSDYAFLPVFAGFLVGVVSVLAVRYTEIRLSFYAP